jgi:hypothetical protein
MICPYCVEEIPANSQKHDDCKIPDSKNFPRFYVDYHGEEGSPDPIVLSVVGFSGHGKTVYLCALFDFIDNVLTEVWPDFARRVIDQDSLSRLEAHRQTLRKGELPDRTDSKTFPRPGVFRLKNMPRSDKTNEQSQPPGTLQMPPLKDTTILIYDPPGEAFLRDDKIVELARFVKRSSCVLFLVALAKLTNSVADEMSTLLNTYILGMRLMEIPEESQHLIVVYTKSDEMKSSVPGFENFLNQHPDLKTHLAEQRPETLANPSAYLRRLEKMSGLLGDFTKNELKATNFINEAKGYFKSVSYTAVSSLGAAPKEDEKQKQTLTIKMSPRAVADPLLYVLSKSIEPEQAPSRRLPQWVLIVGAIAVIVIVLLLLVSLFKTDTNSQTNNANTPAVTAATPLTTPAIRPSPSATPSSTPAGLPKTPVALSRPAILLKEPTDDGTAILSMPRSTMVSPLEEKTDGNGKRWIKIRIENQNCQIGKANYDFCQPVKIARYAGWVRVMLDADRTILSWPDEQPQQATVELNAYLRNKAGDNNGAAILMLYKGTKVALTEEEETIGSYLWRKVEIRNQSGCVSPPPVVSDPESVFTIRVASVEGWLEKDSLNL